MSSEPQPIAIPIAPMLEPLDDFENGRWQEPPWYLAETFAREWDVLRFTPEKRRRATEALKKLFPQETIVEMVRDCAKYSTQIVALWDGVRLPGVVAPFLDLGVDADLLQPWLDPTHPPRFHNRESFEKACFELATHAALVRGGVEVRKVPEAQEKTFDFDVKFRGVTYEVEAKLVDSSDLERASDNLSNRLVLTDLMVDGVTLTLRASDVLTRLAWRQAQEFSALIPEIRQQYMQAVDVVRQTGIRNGTVPAGEWGFVDVEPGPARGSVIDRSMEGLPAEKQASRVVRKVRDGLAQLTGKNRGVLVVGLYGAAQPDDVERLLLNDLRTAQVLAKKCVMVVLCENADVWGASSLVPERIPLFYAFSPLKTRQLRPAEMRLATILASRHWRTAERMDHETPGRITTRLSSSRQPRMLRSLGSANVGPGESATFVIS